ncbi:hypothetical protein ACN47E_001108 [Coniothyrium glycines]
MPPPTKKRKIAVTVPENITFDPAAREEYLTGFHKRKVARIKHAQEENAKREKEEKLRFRRELRQQRKIDLEKHVEEVNRLVKQANGEVFDEHASRSDHSCSSGAEDDDEDDNEDGQEVKGFGDAAPLDQEDEYVDEDKYTTVTIESVGITKAGFLKPGDKDEAEGDADAKEKAAEEEKKEKRVWTKEWPKNNKPKKKKVKFRYETKAERKAERMKQGAKKRKQKEARAKKDEK